ncbi:MAG: 50S ribosomal protein L31e [Nanoarchaeota archaeon]
MAKKETKENVEREYIINLRREILKVPRYRRTPKAVKGIKQFIAKHMKIVDRDTNKVKLDKWLNYELWHKGIQNPPVKIKVKVKREGENVFVSLVDIPEQIKYKMLREEKMKISAEKVKKEKKSEKEKLEKVSDAEKTTEEKVEEKEKEEAVKEAEIKAADLQAREQKHIERMKPAKTPKIQRKALQK